jgi:O-antigen/teichoic acid export membrane protein
VGRMDAATAPPGEHGDDILATSDAGPAAVRGGAFRVVGYLAGALLTAGSAALLFRHLGVVDTGGYVAVLSLIAIVSALSDLGLTAVGVQKLSVLRGDARGQLMRDLLGLRVAVTVAGVLVAIGFAVVAGYRPVLVAGTALAGVGLLFASLQSTFSVSLMSTLRLGWVTIIELGRNALTAALIVALVIAGAELLPFFAMTIVVGLAALAATVVLVRRDVPLVPSFDRGRWWGLLRDVLPYSIAVAAGAVYFRLAVILLSLIATADELGYFGASFRVVEVLIGVPGMLVGAAFPIFARAAHDDRERFVYAVGRVFDASLLAGVWVALGLALGAPLIIDIIAGADFEPAAEILAIQGIGVGASFVGTVFSFALLSLSQYRAILVINVSALVAGLALVATLTATDGATGAAVATAICEVGVAVGSALMLARVDRALLPSLRVVPRVALSAALAASVALLPVGPLVRVVLATAILFGAALALKAVPQELLDEVRRRRHR